MLLRAKPPDKLIRLNKDRYFTGSKLILIMLLYLFGISGTSNAQFIYKLDKTTCLNKMEFADGLTSIQPDKCGFILGRMQNPLNLIDDYNVVKYYANQENPISLLNNYIKTIFEKLLFESENPELNYNENEISFDFSALNDVNPQKNQYTYKTEGYDEDWNYLGNKPTVFHTNLSAIIYTFSVKSSNKENFWDEQAAGLLVSISPPLWKSWWAYLIYVSAFLGLVWLVRWNELRRIDLKQDLEIKKVEAVKMSELDKEKNKFFSNISHEFRTPLTLILGPLRKAIEKLDNDEIKESLKLVQRNAHRLQTLINQLLSLSKLESGTMKLKARPENIVKVTHTLLDSFHSLAVEHGIKTEFVSDAEEYNVYIDNLKFEKIVNNLLSNALKFTEEGGKIKVSVTPINAPWGEEIPRTGVQIKFCDTGIGIRKEKLQHVFDRFYQVDEIQMKTYLGTGIGLALTKELVELHHGEISVDSEPGMGTTFTVFLPFGSDHLAKDEIYDTATAVDEADDQMLEDKEIFLLSATINPKTIDEKSLAECTLPLLLIVDDNADMRVYIKSYLDETYHVLEASNGKEGAEMAIRYLPDLIVSDLMMPFVDGNEMTNQLKNDERTSHIPIILLTAKASAASKLEGLESGADDFLIKPFDAEELLVRIKNLIETRQKLREILSRHIGDNIQTRIIRETAGKAMSKLDEQFLEKIKSIIEEHMSNPEFSVEMLTKELAMSRSQLHRKIKSLIDISASDFIRDIRLMKAAELLRKGELNITQISYEIGISSLSYFSKAFKEKYGVSPSEFA